MIKTLSSSGFSFPKSSKINNQDGFICNKPINNGFILAVADGVGSYKGADKASSIAINTINSIDSYNKQHINNIMNDIHRKIKELYKIDQSYSNASTTLTFCIVQEHQIHVYHIGDCRLYVKSKEKLIQLTNDHTVHREMLEKKIYTKSELKKLSIKNSLTRAISPQLEMEYDYFNLDVGKYTFDKTLSLILMSDGAYHFWDKNKRFSKNTMSNSVKFANAMQRRIERYEPIDDYSLVCADFHIN